MRALSHLEGMDKYLNVHGVLYKHCGDVVQRISNKIKDHAAEYAAKRSGSQARKWPYESERCICRLAESALRSLEVTMSLSCYCGYPDDCDWFWFEPDDYSSMPLRKRRVRCHSCSDLIDTGSIVTEFNRFRYPITDVEVSIYGDGADVSLASWFMCERCSDLYFSLTELGYCVSAEDDMRELVREYAELANAK